MTDETARTILDGNWTIICEAIDSQEKVADLQRMAEWWLLKGEVEQFIDSAIEAAKTSIMMDKRAGTAMLENFFGVPDVSKMEGLSAKLKD